MLPTTTVEVGAFTGLTLDDPIKGELDAFPLDGDVTFTELTGKVFSVSVARGKNRDLDRAQAGTLSVQLRNEDRSFDPKNPGGLYVDWVVPRRPVRVLTGGSAVFRGLIDDWNLAYSPGGEAVASLDASDEFALFARQVNAGGSAVAESSDARLDRVLDQSTVNWPSGRRDIEPGNTTLAAGLLEDNVLNYIQQIDESEQGLVFMSKDGDVALRPRLESIAGTAVRFTDDGSGVPYEQILVTYGSETLTNRSTVESVAGTATANNATSQVTFGITERDFDTLLSTQTQLQSLADYVVARYGTPEYRFENITVNLQALGSAQVADVLGAEIGEQVEVVFTPPGGGSAIVQRSLILGIAHDIGVDDHRVSFSLQELPFQFFILDDPEFGILDGTEAVLGF
jgi:hypothetical protein